MRSLPGVITIEAMQLIVLHGSSSCSPCEFTQSYIHILSVMYFFHAIGAVQRQQMIFMKYFLPRQSSKLTFNGHLFFITNISKHYNFSDSASL